MFCYTSQNGTVIKVGENAKDNDILTMESNPKEWWMHTSGYPGSHVVICYEGDEVPREVKRDAAVLAIHHSKTPESKMSWVDLVRVENVSFTKQRGRVTLKGKVIQLTVFMKRERERLERLLQTRIQPSDVIHIFKSEVL